MATTNTNNMVRQVGGKKSLSYPVDSSGANDFNAGDMVAFDAGVLKPLTVALDGEFAGVVQGASHLALYTESATGAAKKEYAPEAEVLIGQIHSMKTTGAEVYSHGTVLFAGADAQTVTSTDPGVGTIIGYAWMRADVASVTAGADVKVDVLITPNFPERGIA